jgi:integrase
VSSEGEQLHPRNWNFHFIGLPVIDEKKQRKPSLTASEVEQILARAKGRCRVLFALLAGTGLRIGEALGLKIGDHLSGDFSTIRVRQSVWRGSVQTPKTDNAVREIDVPSSALPIHPDRLRVKNTYASNNQAIADHSPQNSFGLYFRRLCLYRKVRS